MMKERSQKILSVLMLLAMGILCLVGCQSQPTYAPLDPTVSVQDTTSEPPDTATAQTTPTPPPETEPPEPYFKDKALLVLDGKVLHGVVYENAFAQVAATLHGELCEYGEVPEMQKSGAYRGEGGIHLVIDQTKSERGYAVFTDERGLVLSADSPESMHYAVKVLCDIMAEHQTKEQTEIPLSALCMDWLPLYPAPEGMTLPEAEKGFGGTLLFAYSNVDKSSYDNYLTDLAAYGYVRHDRSNVGDSAFSTFVSPSHSLSLWYDGRELQVIFDPTSAVLPIEEQEYTTLCDGALVQSYVDYTAGNMGMGYVFVLEDGSFVILDGGTDEGKTERDREHIRLYNLLSKLNRRRDKKIIIRAWIFTNGAYAHTTQAKRFAASYGKRVTVERLLYNGSMTDGQMTENELLSIARHYQNEVSVTVWHIGQRALFCNMQFQALHTPDEAGESTVVSVYYRGQRILFSSDITSEVALALCDRYQDALQSDILQLPNHGLTGQAFIPEAFFRCVSPKTVLWPHSQGCYERDKAAYESVFAALAVSEIFVAQDRAVFLPLPYTYGDSAVTEYQIPSR